MITTRLRAASGAAAALTLSACGGGGGSDEIAAAPPPSPPPASSAFVSTTFSEQANARGVFHGFGFSDDMNVMVRQFAGGGAAGDIDGDGDLDLFVVRGNLGPNLLYINDGGGMFREDAAAANLAFTNGGVDAYRQSGPVFGDVDGDGDLDLFIGGLEGDPSQIHLNDGAGVFTNATDGSGLDLMTSIHTISAAMGDYDRDGDLDLAMAHWGTPRDAAAPGETETLWRNDTDATGVRFTPVSAASGVADGLNLENSGELGRNMDYSFAPSFADLDDDGYPELLLVSDFQTTQVFENNQDGTFTNITDPGVITDSNGMGSTLGDYDRDGDLDWFVSSIDGNRLYDNIGGAFERGPSAPDVALGGWGWGSCFADFNADGFLDIYQTNGWDVDAKSDSSAYVDDQTRLWMAQGDGAFADMAQEADVVDTEQGRGVVCDDIDDDGDVDVLLLTTDAQQAALLWINNLQGANWLTVRLQGVAPNTHAIGARVTVAAGGVTQMREVAINSNFTAHNSPRQYFGLGEAERIDTLTVTWPDGAISTQTDVGAGQVLTIRHPDAP